MNYNASNEEKKENSAGAVSCHCEDTCNSQFLQSRLGIESLARDLNPDILENECEVPDIEEKIDQNPSDTSHISSSDSPTEQQQQQTQVEENVLLHRRNRITPEDVFNRNNLQYLTQNVENLREILQVVATNAEFAQSLSYEMQRRSTFHFGTARALNNVQSSILNSQNQIYEQLHQIRSIVDENRTNEQQTSVLGWLISLFSAHRNSQANPNSPRVFSNKIQRVLEKNYQKIFYFTFIASLFLALWATLQDLNSSELNLTNLLLLMESPRQSRFFTMASTFCYFLALIQFHQKLHRLFFAEAEYHFWKNLKMLIPEYSPFYDSGFYILANPEIIQNKISFCFMLWLLLWNILITKTSFLVYQKLNNVVMSAGGGGLTSNFLALQRVKFLSLIYLFFNLTLSFGVIWKVWDASFQTLLIFLTMTLLSQLEPLKIFLSSFILTKNYSLITNNNTKELKDPRFQIELYLDFTSQALTLILISFLAFFYTSFLIGFVVLCWMSFNNVIQKLNQCFTKYSSWKKLNKKLNELFPLVEQTATDEICSICHDNLLIYRKIPCGHKFHLKCLFYWIETQRTCPNCRGGVPNVSEILTNY